MIKKLFRHIIPESLRPSVLVARLVDKLLKSPEVAGGIFTGLKYVDQSQGSEHIPKLLGCYELELQPTLTKLLKSSWRRIVVVGGGEGYYAAGLARLRSEVPVHVFEASEKGRQLILEMASKNKVEDQLTIEGLCKKDDLKRVLGDGSKTLLIMDVEGAEMELLNPLTIPALLYCIIIVEVHEFVWPRLCSTLSSRFEATSHVQMIPTRDRNIAELPYPSNFILRWWMGNNLLLKTGEARPGPMQWLVISPRFTGASTI